MGGVQHLKLRNLATGAILERRFRPGESVELVEVERQRLQYLYQDDEFHVFMNPENFEQVPIHASQLGDNVRYLKEGLEAQGLFQEEALLSLQFPDHVDLRVTVAPPPLHEQDTTTPKTVILENGMEILAPQFIKEGDLVRVSVETGKYMERL